MRRIDWSNEARSDVREAVTYLSEFDGVAARRLRRRIDDVLAMCLRHAVGRKSRVSDLWEMPVSGTRYTIAYSVTDDALFVVRVVHQSRDWPEEGWPAD